MFYYYYWSVHKKQTYVFWVNDLHKTKFLNACDELPIGCSQHRNQVLNTSVILAQRYVSFISFILHETFVMQLTYVIVGI
jgi:hypothetical protein